MTIPQPVINTFNRVGLDYSDKDSTEKVEISNRFTGQSVTTSPLIARCIDWVYRTSNQFELEFTYRAKNVPTIADFDRVRYFVLKIDPQAYMTCLD